MGCPDRVKSLMLSCWKRVPQDRIAFDEIVKKLEEGKSTSPEYSNPAYGLNDKLRFTNTRDNSNPENETYPLLENTNSDTTYDKPMQWPKLTNFSPVDNQDNQHSKLQSDTIAQPQLSKEKYVVVLSDINEESESGNS